MTFYVLSVNFMLIYDVDVENFILFYILCPVASLQMTQKLHLLLSCLHKDLILDNDFSDQNILLLNMFSYAENLKCWQGSSNN